MLLCVWSAIYTGTMAVGTVDAVSLIILFRLNKTSLEMNIVGRMINNIGKISRCMLIVIGMV